MSSLRRSSLPVALPRSGCRHLVTSEICAERWAHLILYMWGVRAGKYVAPPCRSTAEAVAPVAWLRPPEGGAENGLGCPAAPHCGVTETNALVAHA